MDDNKRVSSRLKCLFQRVAGKTEHGLYTPEPNVDGGTDRPFRGGTDWPLWLWYAWPKAVVGL